MKYSAMRLILLLFPTLVAWSVQSTAAATSESVETHLHDLQSTNWNTRLHAVEELAYDKNTASIVPLIAALRDTAMRVVCDCAGEEVPRDFRQYVALPKGQSLPKYLCERVAFALGNISSLAQEPELKELRSAIRDKDPFIRERVAFAIAYAGIKDPSILAALDSAMRDRDYPVIAGAYLYYIRQGKIGTEESLITALEKFGYGVMAWNMHSCGNAKVVAASEKWAIARGIPFPSMDSGLTWGKHE